MVSFTRALMLVSSLLVVGAFVVPSVSKFMRSSLQMSTKEHQQTRREWFNEAAAVPLAVAAVAGVSGALPAQAVPAIAPTTGLPASGFFVQHAVIMVNDMNANIKVCGACFNQLQVLRHRGMQLTHYHLLMLLVWVATVLVRWPRHARSAAKRSERQQECVCSIRRRDLSLWHWRLLQS
jgi:hypothetical protein